MSTLLTEMSHLLCDVITEAVISGHCRSAPYIGD